MEGDALQEQALLYAPDLQSVKSKRSSTSGHILFLTHLHGHFSFLTRSVCTGRKLWCTSPNLIQSAILPLAKWVTLGKLLNLS